MKARDIQFEVRQGAEWKGVVQASVMCFILIGIGLVSLCIV